jgi:hypothetical protein
LPFFNKPENQGQILEKVNVYIVINISEQQGVDFSNWVTLLSIIKG